MGDRVITIQPHDLNELSPDGHDAPWGTGKVGFENILREIHRLGIQPTLFGLEYSYKFENNMPEMAKCVKFFDKMSIEALQWTRQP